MSEGDKFDLSNAQFGGGFAAKGNAYSGQIINNNYPSDKNLADAAKEIQELLIQLEQTNPTNTASEKEKVVQKAIQKVENDPTLQERLIGALQAGTVETFKQMVNHPLVHIFVETVKGGKNPN
ncbi:MAG: hypothetical protein F6K31_09655 [Symploca sp. SIO2G7]|nr:hypothetical protein [Symploca sp. SIO2G7]